jgi:hypothetical protein|tara:strand:- start:1981 stop:2097 length:117 start_codon:yes stop_codon:yes gene_type:complete
MEKEQKEKLKDYLFWFLIITAFTVMTYPVINKLVWMLL